MCIADQKKKKSNVHATLEANNEQHKEPQTKYLW